MNNPSDRPPPGTLVDGTPIGNPTQPVIIVPVYAPPSNAVAPPRELFDAGDISPWWIVGLIAGVGTVIAGWLVSQELFYAAFGLSLVMIPVLMILAVTGQTRALIGLPLLLLVIFLLAGLAAMQDFGDVLVVALVFWIVGAAVAATSVAYVVFRYYRPATVDPKNAPKAIFHWD